MLNRQETSSLTATDTGLDVVTGAFGYSGRAIARRLNSAGRQLRTLTNHHSDPATTIDVRPLSFGDRATLTASLEGATTLYNTYWVRFAHGGANHDEAVSNSLALFEAARAAGVQRIVHVSITNPSSDSPYPYFRGKAAVEAALRELGIPYAILRPSVLFGRGDVLINNIAWLLRRLPVFAIGGRGDYRLRPIHVDDLADLAVGLGAARDDVTVDAVGPDRPTFNELVMAVASAVRRTPVIVHVPGPLVPPLARVLSVALRDVLLTDDEYRAMADGLADTGAPPTGTVHLRTWIATHHRDLGRTYANELDRHYRR